MVDITGPPSAPSPAAPTAQNGTAENTPSLSPPPGASPDRDVDPREASKAPDPEAGPTADMKKAYLSLLPPEQIIEICLLFETYVPPSVRTAAWPTDLEAAVNDLKKKAAPLGQSTQPSSHPHHNGQTVPPLTNGTSHPSSSNTPPTHQVHPPEYYAPSLPPPARPIEDPPMGSLRDPAEEAREREEKEKAKASAPDSATASHPPSPAPQTNGEPSSSAAPSSHVGTPQPPGQVQHATLHPPAPYPYAHYGYAVPPQGGQQPAYPHTPYYPPPHAYTSHYPYPHYPQPPSGYPPPPPGHSPPPPPPPPGQQPLFNSQPLVRPPVHPPAPPQPPPPSGEDLPSYEEMIVEALVDCGDAEGAAPKDLFTWMASRYPLQTNFRPSASQALQKAYKRGRLEKRSGGKYRLNANWEGGATSKRTTRRPQTLAQTTYAMHHPPQPSSPFTHAPLQQHNNNNTNNNQPPKGQQPSHYPGYQYQYPYGHYPGYPQPQQPAAEKSAAPAATASATSTAEDNTPANGGEEKDEGDAWEAAQHILQAINFSSLASGSVSADRPGSPPGAALTSSAADELGAALAALTNAAAAAAAAAEAAAEAPRMTLTDDERASLQAQLALLAAQLTEIAEDEEEEEEPTPSTAVEVMAIPTQAELSYPAPVTQPTPAPPPATAPPPAKTVELPPPPIAAYSGTHLVLDINAFPEVFESITPANASAAQTDVDELAGESSDDDDDMEEVVVPLQGHDALRT